MDASVLERILTQLRHRRLTLGAAAAALWACLAVVLTLIVAAWLDLLLDLSAGARASTWLVAVGLSLAVIAVVVRRSFRDSRTPLLANRLDAARHSAGQIATGVSLMRHPPANSNATTTGLTSLAIARAGELAASSPVAAAVPAREMRLPIEGLGVVVFLLLAAALLVPRLVNAEAARLFDPYGDHPPYSPLVFSIMPGDTRVVYGSNADVQATITGGVAEDVKLVLRRNDQSETALPMFAEGNGKYRASVLNVDTPQQYYVRSGRARSERFNLDAITIPNLEDVTFSITLPAYTHRPQYRGPVPQGGISGLPGTKVDVAVRSNRELKTGKIHFVPAAGPNNNAAAMDFAMTPSGDEKIVVGSFPIMQPGRIELGVTDREGQLSVDPFAAPVTVLNDEKPFVRVTSPKPNSFATPDAVLDVSALAEDDFGVSKVSIFRSLNDSRYRATDAAVPETQPMRVPASLPLKLADYGLRPGDVVKLFVRVEDNDPAGAKGTESNIVTLTVISQADLDQLVVAKQGLEAMEAKYAQARRAMEIAAAKAKKQDEALAKQDPAGTPSDEQRKALEGLAKELEKAATAAEKQADRPLPLDLDKAMSPQLGEAAKAMREAADAAWKAAQPGMSVSGAEKELKKLQAAIGKQQEEMAENVQQPLDQLDSIYPLLEDQARFLQLAEQQRDLAERMKSLVAKANDSPEAKTRMRDLQEEQAAARQQTDKLLSDIEDHAAKLPADPRLDQIKATAKQFCEAAREIDPQSEMHKAEDALQTFAGSPAATSSGEAAQRLEKLIGHCNAMGDEGGQCLSFNPKLSQALGNTVKQLLDGKNLGQGKSGGGGGYSAQRQTMQNVGLYGTVPVMGKESSMEGGGQAERGTATDANGRPTFNANPDGTIAGGQSKSAGMSDAPVPPAYKDRVSDYFRRVADELETAPEKP